MTWFKEHWPITLAWFKLWRWWILCALVVITCISVVVTLFLKHRDTPCLGLNCSGTTNVSPSPSNSPSPSPTPIQAESRLNGVLVDQSVSNLKPLAVMIENYPDARPQAGLASADLVYEAIAEGGITRFMAVFGNPTNEVKVGPIRSARPYYVDFATELGAFFAHVGGNYYALQQIKETNVYDLNQFSIGEPVFHRESNRAVATEHTMYSSTKKLWDYALNVRKWPNSATYTPWTFIDPAPLDKRGLAGVYSINFSGPLYQVDWQYQPGNNLYTRSQAGSPHLDQNTESPVQASCVIIEIVNSVEEVTSPIGEKGLRLGLTGTGKAQIWQNGQILTATWKKNGSNRTQYFDSAGQEISFVRGKIWVELVSSSSQLKTP